MKNVVGRYKKIIAVGIARAVAGSFSARPQRVNQFKEGLWDR